VSLTSPRPSSRSPRHDKPIILIDGTYVLTAAQETAHLEAQAFELEQKTAIAHEAKVVLDSWVRYEGQVKQRQQKELADSIIAKIEKELENPKTLKQILDQSVTDVESTFTRNPSRGASANTVQGSSPRRHKRFQHTPVKFDPCYINLCNSQTHPIESTQGLEKAKTISFCFTIIFCIYKLTSSAYNLGLSSGSRSLLIVFAQFCATSWLIAFSS
jgi:hypothetical protein